MKSYDEKDEPMTEAQAVRSLVVTALVIAAGVALVMWATGQFG